MKSPKTPRRLPGRLRLAAAVCASALGGCIARRALYPAPRFEVPSPPPKPLTEVFLAIGPHDSVSAWYRPHPSLPDTAPALLYLHGNGENLGTMYRWGLFERLSALGVHLLAIDYPGYGLSTGKPSEQSIGHACDTALAWLARRHEHSPVIVCGWSLGAAAAIAAAARNPHRCHGLVAMSAWTTVSEVAAQFYPRFLVRLFLRDRYNSLEAIGRVRSPLLLIHGREDRLIPHDHGKALMKAAHDKRQWVSLPGRGHNDLLDDPRVWQTLTAFTRSLR